MFLEYPKHVYPNGDIEQPSKIVKDADEEAAAAAEGYQAIAVSHPEAAPAVGSVAHLDYPRHVYVGGDLDADSRLVRNADEEAAAAEEGYQRYSPAQADAPEGAESADAGDEKPKGRSRRKK